MATPLEENVTLAGKFVNSYMDDVNGKDFRIGSIVNRVTFDD